MKIIVARPPLFGRIDEKFKIAGKPVIFAFGDVIYNPENVVVPPELVKHEEVHSQRQGDNPLGWWTRYIDDQRFRFDEELPAHRAEYRAYCSNTDDRERRARALHVVAMKLSAKLYGNMITYGDAKRAIAAEA